MTYLLEDSSEAARLERQSKATLYNPVEELRGFRVEDGHQVLDAGCGSGLVARMIATEHPGAKVLGIDGAEARVAEARKLAQGIGNIDFRSANLAEPLGPNKFDRIVCRYVLEHMGEASQNAVVQNLAASLKKGGQIRLIDVDGVLLNIFPRTRLMQECLQVFENLQTLDLFVGRKLPKLLTDAGLSDVTWHMEPMAFSTPELLKEETKLVTERFQNTLASMSQILGSESRAKNFQAEYLKTLQQPGAVMYYNKFIVTGTKGSAGARRLKVVKEY